MRLAQKTVYALRALYELSRGDLSSVRAMKDIAQQQEIPFNFLQVIMRELRAAGFVESRRGKEGGYVLARAPQDISMGEVMSVLEGDLSPVEIGERMRWPEGVFVPVWEEVAEAVNSIYNKVTFADLVQRGESMLEGPIEDFVI